MTKWKKPSPQSLVEHAEVRRRQERRQKYEGRDLRARLNEQIEPKIRESRTEAEAIDAVRSYWEARREWDLRRERALRLWPEDLSKPCLGDMGELGDLALVAEDWEE